MRLGHASSGSLPDHFRKRFAMPYAESALTTATPSRSPSPPWHGGLFVAAFVCAHLAALGAAYAAAALQTRGHELPASAPGHHAVHHLGRMTLMPLSALPAAHAPRTHR